MLRLQQGRVLLLVVLFLFVSAAAEAGEITPQLQRILDSSGPNENIAVIVQLEEQVDRKQFKKFKKKLRRLKLLKQLKKKAENDQASLQSYVKGRGAKKMRRLWIINGLAVEATPALIRKLAKRPEVLEVRLDRPVPLINDTMSATAANQWNLAMVGVDDVWSAGYLGQGVVIASMDSGVDYRHNELGGNWRGGTNSWFDPHGEHALPYDADGHGTQTAGIMFAENLGLETIGMAPRAQWVAVKVFADNGDSFTSDIHEGFQWLLDPDNDPNTDDAPDIVNNSWGFPETENTCDTEFDADLQLLRDLGISVVFSSGNLGSGPSSISPANNPGVFAVGAVDQNSIIASFSSQGPSACDPAVLYPAAVAPGYLINTTDLTFGGLFSNATILATGTSFAAPHVSGAMALLLSAYPDLAPADLENIIKQSAQDLGDIGEDYIYGSGLLNVAEAYASQGNPDPDPDPDPDPCSDSDGDGFYVEATCAAVVDCDDSDATVYPGAVEVKNDGTDQDCNGYDLTIVITRSLYRSGKDKLVIYATSALGAEADLQVDIPGIGITNLTWKATKQRWQKVIKSASAKGLQADSTTSISVFGPEGTVISGLTIK